MKIGFFTNSTIVLERYWNKLRARADCWWAVTQPSIYHRLKKKGINNVVYHYDKHVIDLNKTSGNMYVSTNPGESERIIAEKVRADLWIADTLNKLNRVNKTTFWVQVFHSLPLKKHFFYPPVLEYDLILLPGEYHKNELINRLNLNDKDEARLQVVGWPRADDFFNDTFDRQKIMKSLGLDVTVKTVMYAPTWGWGHGNEHLFARWHDEEIEVFEQLCYEVKKMNVNFIVKLHNLSFHVTNDRLIEIAKKYDVLWATKDMGLFVDDPNEFLWVTDVLISDVSGIIADFLVLDRPIIYIDPDENLNAWD
ncbi:MAG TPA: hypothetical protein EYO39_01190, partial [Nitrospirales bacterium]|nr:hypothetical protein [Nitrospirales bacterium]